MTNFEFQNPVKLIFGKGEIAKLAKEIPSGTKVMMTYGGGSIFKNGIHAQVTKALQGCTLIEFGGIEANPDYNTLMRAVEICKAKRVEMLLAVGGGSIIDGTKFIAAAVNYAGDPWEMLTQGKNIPAALPFATVLTLPATGSEMNCGAVISRRDRNEKFAFMNPQGFPKFSILDPTAIYSLPKRQVANGIIDTYAHTLEQYLTVNNHTMVMDKWAEALLTTLITLAPRLLRDERTYADCADFMLTATMGLNGFIAMGVVEDWATHMIGHELTALHGLDHGVTLAIVHPGVMQVMRSEKHDKLVQYAERVWGINEGSDDEKIDKAIARTKEFYNSLGVKTRLSEYGIGEQTVDTIVTRFRQRGWNVGERGIVTPEKVALILHKVM